MKAIMNLISKMIKKEYILCKISYLYIYCYVSANGNIERGERKKDKRVGVHIYTKINGEKYNRTYDEEGKEISFVKRNIS